MEFLEELLNACSCGDESRIIHLLEKGISLNDQNAEGETPLQIASANGCLDIVNLLLNQGAFVDLSNNYGWTPLMHATLHGHSEVVALLLSRKAKVNTFNKLGLAAVDFAASNGDLPILKLLIEAGAVVDRAPVVRKSEWEFSSLMAAAIQGHDEMFKFLLERGSAVNYTSPIAGLTPLMLAACAGHQSIVKMIIEHGGNINKINICGKSAIDMAIECCHGEIEEYLDSVSRRNSGSCANDDILQAIRNGDLLKVKSIIQQNPDTVNIYDGFDGTTPLMLAATFGHNDIVEALINDGADLDVQDMSDGRTALMYAVFHRNAETVKLLIEKGARIDVFAYTGYTALDLATYIGSSDSDVFQVLSASCEIDNSMERFSCSSPLGKCSQGFLLPEENQISVSVQKSPTQSRSKKQPVNISQGEQLKMPICSSKFLAASPIATSGESNDESEELSDLDSSCETHEKPASDDFKFLLPDKYLASTLEDHKVETIRPIFLSCHMEDVNTIPSRETSSESINKLPMNSLRTPHLVKLLIEKRRMKFGATNTLPLDDSLLELEDSLLEFEVSTLKQEDSSLKPHDSTLCLDDSPSETGDSVLKLDDSTLKLDDSTLKFDDLTLKLNDLTLKLEDDMLKTSNSSLKSSDITLNSVSNPCAQSVSCSVGADRSISLLEKECAEKAPVSEIERGEDAAKAGDLTVLLNKESLQKYVQKFRDQEIDLESFLCLTEEDFKKIGIEAHDSRQKCLDIISKMRNT